MLSRNCRVYIALYGGGRVRPGQRLGDVYSSAQLRSVMAAGMRHRSVMWTERGRGGRSIIKIRAEQCFNRWPQEGGHTTLQEPGR